MFKMNRVAKALGVSFVLLLAVWSGHSNKAYARTYRDINAQRAQVGLRPLTGNNQIDFQILVNECNRGIRYSCTLAKMLQSAPRQQAVPVQQRGPQTPPSGKDLLPKLLLHKCQNDCQMSKMSCDKICGSFIVIV
jgi:hypothetical protein